MSASLDRVPGRRARARPAREQLAAYRQALSLAAWYLSAKGGSRGADLVAWLREKSALREEVYAQLLADEIERVMRDAEKRAG